MTTTTIKKELHKAIDNMGDSSFLKAVYAMFKEYTITYDGTYQLSPAEKDELDEQKELHKAGKTKSYTLSEVRKLAVGKVKK
jgi:hypothetical protein